MLLKRIKRLHSKTIPGPVQSLPHLHVKRKQWSNESMLAALHAIKEGMSINRAAVQYGVPRTTLNDRHLGKVMHGTNPVQRTYLTAAEESELAEFVQVCAQIGYGKTRKQVMNIAEYVAKEKGVLKKTRITHGWFRRFLQRHPILRLRKGDVTARVRIDAMNNREALESYFTLFKKIMEENKLTDKPGQLYNVDETGMPLDHRPPKVLAVKGQKKVRYCTSGNKSQITVIGCVNATGTAIPPFVIFDAKSLNIEWTEGEVPGTIYGLSDRGWVDIELFKGWFNNHFLRHAVASRPILLLLDGHSSHCYNPETIREAKKNDVILFTLVPHTTHETQPLDTAVFSPLKAHWKEACHKFIQANPGRVITKYQFSSLLSESWMKTMVPSTTISGFRKCGVFPFDPKAVLKCDLPKNLNKNHQSCTQAEADTRLFTVEEQKRFSRWYKEGYDLYDHRYAAWLNCFHPRENSLQDMDSVADAFSVVQPLLPIATTVQVNVTGSSSLPPLSHVGEHIGPECSPPSHVGEHSGFPLSHVEHSGPERSLPSHVCEHSGPERFPLPHVGEHSGPERSLPSHVCEHSGFPLSHVEHSGPERSLPSHVCEHSGPERFPLPHVGEHSGPERSPPSHVGEHSGPERSPPSHVDEHSGPERSPPSHVGEHCGPVRSALSPLPCVGEHSRCISKNVETVSLSASVAECKGEVYATNGFTRIPLSLQLVIL